MRIHTFCHTPQRLEFDGARSGEAFLVPLASLSSQWSHPQVPEGQALLPLLTQKDGPASLSRSELLHFKPVGTTLPPAHFLNKFLMGMPP